MLNKKKKAAILVTGSSARVPESVVRAEPRPKFTETWHPFSHAEVLDAVGQACKKMGLKIGEREYSIRKKSKMFAIWEIENGGDGFNFGIGIRNSIDKSCSLGLCAGKRIFVCDNLVLQGEYILFRKHTGKLEFNEIVSLAYTALQLLMPKFDELRQWHERMKSVSLTSAQASLLTVAAMAKSLIPPSKFRKFYELYQGYGTEYTPTLHGWHGALTELMNPNSILTITKKQEKLNRFIDYEALKILEYGAKGAIDFFQIEKDAREKFQEDLAIKKKEARTKKSRKKKRKKK